MNDVIYRKDVLELFEDINNMLNQTLEDFTLAYPTTKICEFCRDVINDLTDDVKELPSAEPSIIQCKDCKWYGRADKRRFYRGMDCLQHRIDTIVPDKDFCSRAERREA